MARLRGITAYCVAFLFIVSCASAGSSAEASDRIVPPQMVSRAPLPRMSFMRSGVPGAQTYRIDIEVVIDSTGAPDMSTFRATGSTASQNRDALYEWIRASMFRPATRNGHPVSAILHTELAFRAR